MGNKHENRQSKKCRRKIRIRLADPNIPDSYVCEIFDSSLENEDEPSNNFLRTEKSLIQNDYSKPKNYFELLMSKESKKNSAKEIEESPEKRVKKKNNKKSAQLENLNGNINVTDSSDDESLFQIQRKFKSERDDNKIKLDNEVEINELEIQDDETITILDSKVDFSKKKTLSILNYFSPKVIPNSNKFHKAKCKDLEQINDKNSLGAKNNLKPNTDKNLVQNEYKSSLNGINKENVKLAPLFTKKEKKVIDPATQKARLDFLFKSQSLMKKSESSKIPENNFTFPTIPHIQQRDDSLCWSVREISIPNCAQHLEEYVFKSDKKFRININNSPGVGNETKENERVDFNRDFLSRIKLKYQDLNLDSVFDGLKDKRDKFRKRAVELRKSVSSNDESGFEVLNALWTEKYKPKSYDFLGNGNVVSRLRKWLQAWKTFDEELKALVKSGKKLKSQRDSDDSEDFVDSDDDFGLKSPGNVCLLSGPNGCGKTALVFALANELEFNVLEVNASSKRTGKKVLSDLQEATQSHKVHRITLFQNETEKKKKKKVRKRKKTKKTDEPVKILDQGTDCKISLILIEDADIVFEDHDEGFVSGIASLAQTSKRPLIFLCNDANCPLLENFKTEQCLILEMEPPNFYKSCAVLDVVSSLEGISPDRASLEFLLCQNNFDLRKSLLELEFWTEPGLKMFKVTQPLDLGCLWWGLSKFLYGREIVRFVKPQTRKRKRMSDFFDSSDDEETTKKLKLQSDDSRDSLPVRAEPAKKSDPAVHSYFNILDSVSTLDCFRLSSNDEPIPAFDYTPKDSLSLDENMEEVSWGGRNLTEQLANEMVTLSTGIFARKCTEKEAEYRKISFESPSWEEIRWRKSQKQATAELSVLVPLYNGGDKRSLVLDYLPALRSICRVGRNRMAVNPKRKNRFYHYLNNLGVELTDENVDINCEIFNS